MGRWRPWGLGGPKAANEERVAPPADGMDRLPGREERLVRSADGKGFVVTHLTTIEGGERRFALRSADGKEIVLGCDDLFPARGPQPFRFGA